MKADVVPYGGRCISCKSCTVTQSVKRRLEIIIIGGDQLKSQQNIPEYLAINEKSNFFILVLVSLFINVLGHFVVVSVFHSST